MNLQRNTDAICAAFCGFERAFCAWFCVRDLGVFALAFVIASAASFSQRKSAVRAAHVAQSK
jgi:hypothetical protein